MGSGASKKQQKRSPESPLGSLRDPCGPEERSESHKTTTSILPKKKNKNIIGNDAQTHQSMNHSHHHQSTQLIVDSDNEDFDSASVQVTDRELEDLESSLMGIPSLKDVTTSPFKEIIPRNDLSRSNYHEENGNFSIPSSPLQTHGQNSNSFYEFARKRPKRTGDVRRTSSLGRSNTQFTTTTTAITTSSNRRPYQRSVEDAQRLRFSWDDRKTNSANAFPSLDRENEEEWTYKKSVIDGFDVAKFKKVNSSKTDLPSSFVDSTHGRNGLHESQMPGVPSYDVMEQQLLASLEREILLN
eukprot:TRINITY_DN25284_c0_g1_i1.p1 TRINITY_DN25284_c0_g1~~TRINITY_DN25284_c0_g1_i1.p1  ORF type:complete len:299 (-),score=62.09 TRINITY_DN25284_c0_g1_i1:89-985(-)